MCIRKDGHPMYITINGLAFFILLVVVLLVGLGIGFFLGKRH